MANVDREDRNKATRRPCVAQVGSKVVRGKEHMVELPERYVVILEYRL